jgi:dienelactone hydrolase
VPKFLLKTVFYFAFAVMLAPLAGAQNMKVEKIEIATQSLSNFDFLTGKKEGKPAKITGELRLPGAAKEKSPVVLLVHGSGGVGANIHYWVAELNKLGIATFAIDSFTGRGVKDTVTDQSQVSNFTMVFDAYRALEILAKHPGIDRDRIAIMGFSKGGIVALYSSMQRFQDMHLEKGLRFAAHLPFYAQCSTDFIDDTKISKVPLRLFHGTADDYTPLGACKDYVARLKSAGADAVLFEFQGAHHAYDNPRIVAPLHLPKASTARKCFLEEKQPGIVFNKATGQRFSATDACIERGTTVAYNAAATAASNKQVAAILKEVFKLK